MKKIRLLLLLILGFTFSYSSAQKIEHIKEGVNGVPKIIKFDASSKSAYDSKTLLKKYLPLKAEDEYKIVNKETDKLGFKHEKFQQYYKGVKIEHAFYSVHTKNGVVKSMNGKYFDARMEKSSNVPSISEEAALQKALNFIGAKKYMWKSETNEAWAKNIEASGTFKPSAEIVYIKDYYSGYTNNLIPVLAYKFNIYAEKPLSRDFVYVNAHTGKIVLKNPIIKTYKHTNNNNTEVSAGTVNNKLSKPNANAYAATRYSGNKIIKTSIRNNEYVLREYTRGNGIETFNMQTGTNYDNAVDFTDANNQWTALEYDNDAKDNAALDVHWATEMVWDYWMIKHGRNSFDGNGGSMKSYVHFDQNYANAYWNGEVMTYGDGSGGMDALTCLDITAHEIGHAVMEYTAALIYRNESGAMNEGFSDIWGACVEYYAAPNKNTWLIGEDIGNAMRDMSNPNAKNDPDTYFGAFWKPLSYPPSPTPDYGGVHSNNGVLNFWFYLLTEGGSGANDHAFPYSVSGIGIEKAAKIAYRTEALYLNPDAQFADARDASVQAAEDLYNAGSNEVQQVKNAWDAVGVYDIPASVYCLSAADKVLALTQVDIGDSFSNSSGPSNYSDFTAQTIDLTTGDAHNIHLVQANPNGMYWRIWIDLNGDYDFNDEGEQIFSHETDYGALEVSSAFIMPDATVSTTRMRVSIGIAESYGWDPPYPCSVIGWGEVEDYTVNITQGTGTGEIDLPPSSPSPLAASNITENSVDLNWNTSTDDNGVFGYKIYKDGTETKTVTGTNTTISGLSENTTYQFFVKAFDGSDNLSSQSNSLFITTLGGSGDNEAPTTPQNLIYSGVTETEVTLNWEASTDNVAVKNYTIYQNNVPHSSVTGTSALITGLTPGAQYNYRVRAYDLSGNASSYSNRVYVRTGSSNDTQSPTAPSNLAYSNVSYTSLNLDWGASTDNVAVEKYIVYKNGAYETELTGTSTMIVGLTEGTQYSFYVRAYDPSGNASANSNTVSPTTESTTDNTPPTTPTNLYAVSVGQTDVYLKWDESTDNFGVSHYNVYRNGTFDRISPGNSVIIDGLNPETTHTFHVTAEDFFGNLSGQSNTISVTLNGTLPYDAFRTYCDSWGSVNSFEWIDYFGFNGIFGNPTGAESGGYGDYTGTFTPILLSPNTSYTLVISSDYTTTYTEYWRMWLDYNRDGDFDDTGELLGQG